MATMKELKELSAKALAKHHEYERRIQAIREKRKETCPHEKTKLVDQDYMEVGRMSSPIRRQELVCCKCKKVLATRGEKTEMSEWQPEEGVSLNGVVPVAEPTTTEFEHTLEVSVQVPASEVKEAVPGSSKPGTIRIVKRADAERGQ